MRNFKLRYVFIAVFVVFVAGLLILLFEYNRYKDTFYNSDSNLFPYNQISYVNLNDNYTNIAKLNIAILDTGFDKTQTYSRYQNVHYDNITNSQDNYNDVHGSAITDIILNSEITKNLFKCLNFYIIRVGSDKDINVNDLTKGVEMAIDLKADIINISLGTYEDNKLLKESITKALSKNIVVVCSAGNDYTKKYLYPASYEGVISVSSVDNNGIALLNNNFNDRVTLSAPREQIPTHIKDKNGAEVKETGSSPACALVTDIIIALKSINNKLTSDDIRKVFQLTCSKSDDNVSNYTAFTDLE